MHLFSPGVFHTYLCVINVDFDRWRKKCSLKRDGNMPQCVKCKLDERLLYYLLLLPAGLDRLLQVDIQAANMRRNRKKSISATNRPRFSCCTSKLMWNVCNVILNLELENLNLSNAVYLNLGWLSWKYSMELNFLQKKLWPEVIFNFKWLICLLVCVCVCVSKVHVFVHSVVRAMLFLNASESDLDISITTLSQFICLVANMHKWGLQLWWRQQVMVGKLPGGSLI